MYLSNSGAIKGVAAWILVASFLLSDDIVLASHGLPLQRQGQAFTPFQIWGVTDRRNSLVRRSVAFSPRGGSSKEEELEGDQYDDEDEEQSDYAGDDQAQVVEADETTESEDDDEAEITTDGVQIEINVAKYDEPLVASPFTNLFASLGVMVLARKYDLFHPTVVRIARFAFISYIILLQLFLFYVRIQAKRSNDRTPIELKSPLTSLLQSQLGAGSEGGGNGMMKNLASSFLSSKSTVLEYDLKQARGMQSGLIFNMLFMWFLHFKMEQVQPLLIQTANGLTTMVYSPLFQIYILGRNLERPFKNPVMKAVEKQATTEDDDDDNSLESAADVDEEGDEVNESDSEGDDNDKFGNETAVVDEAEETQDEAVEGDDEDKGDDDNGDD